MEDKQIQCKECNSEFVFTEGEQEFYKEKGFENEPQRCPSCRQSRKQSRRNNRESRQMFSTVCSECGVETEVPFEPSGDKPVYCRECYQARR